MSIFSLVIFLAFIYIIYFLMQSLLGKSKNENGQKKYPMPSFGNQKTPQTSETMDSKKKQAYEATTTLQQRDKRFDRSVTHNIKEMEEIDDKTELVDNLEDSHYAYDQDQHEAAIELDEENLTLGLVLAEVLGPPRAKNPHSSIKYHLKN